MKFKKFTIYQTETDLFKMYVLSDQHIKTHLCDKHQAEVSFRIAFFTL